MSKSDPEENGGDFEHAERSDPGIDPAELEAVKVRAEGAERKLREIQGTFNAAKAELDATKADVSFGSQIRSYVFQPYTMVNDHRTELKITDVQRVMDGDIDAFIEAYLKRFGAAGGGVAAA